MRRFCGRPQDDEHRHRLAERPPQTEHRRSNGAATPERQDRHPDDLPLGGSEGLGRFHVAAGSLPVHLAGDGGDDRQDHDGEHDPGREDRATASDGHVAGGEKREPAQGLVEERRDGREDGSENEDSPQPVHDRRDCGQHVDDTAEDPCQPGWGVLGQVDGDADGDRHGQDEGERRAQHGHDEQVADAEAEIARVGGRELGAGEEVGVIRHQRRNRLQKQEDRDQGDRHHDRQP